MKILLLGHQYRNYGTYWRLFFLARGLVKLGHQVTLACVSPDSRWKYKCSVVDGVEIWEGPHWLHDLPGQGTGPLDILGRLKIIRSKKWDVIHGFEFHPNIRFPMYTQLKNKQTAVLSDWCDWYSQAGLGPKWGKMPGVKPLIAWQEDNVRKKVDGVTVISHVLAKRAAQLQKSENRVLYIPGGAPIDVIQVEDKKQCRKKWNIETSKKVVAFVGTNQEDLDLLVDAFILVAAKEPKSMLLLIGPSNDHAMIKIKENNLEKRIHITGRFDYEDLSSLMGCADVFALPLRDTLGNSARWPNKIGEYLSAGRPVVTSNAGEMKYLFQEQDLGDAVANDPHAFCDAILKLFNNEVLAGKFGKTGRQVAETVLAWDKLSKQLESFYKNTLEQKK